MKVWIVWGDNGETYEDHSDWVESVHRSKAGADRAMKRLNAKAEAERKLYRPLTTYTVRDYKVRA